MAEQIRIVRSDLEQKVNEGWKKQQLAEHYGLPVAQMTRVLRDAGLRIRKFHNPKYVLVDEVLDDAHPYEAQAVLASQEEAYENAEASTQQNETGTPAPTTASVDTSW